MTDKTRAEFEADAGPLGFDLTRDEEAARTQVEPWTHYHDEATGHRYAGWLAALATKAAPEPVAWLDAKTLHEIVANPHGAIAMHRWLAICAPDPFTQRTIPMYTTPPPAPLGEPPEWRPIETAPKDGTAVLVMRNIWPGTATGFAEDCNGHNTYVAAWWTNRWVCYMDWIDDPTCPIKPTHWMPIPAPPTNPAQAEKKEM